MCVLPSCPAAHLNSQAVVELLRTWQLHDVPLRTARSKWLASISRANTHIANFRDQVRALGPCECASPCA